MRPPGSRVLSAAAWAGVAVAYYAAGWAGLRVAVFPEVASPGWPATGVAIAALTLLGVRLWPAIAVAALAVQWPVFGAVGATIAAAGITAEAVVGAWALRRMGGATAFTHSSGMGRFIGIAAVAPVASTLTGTWAVTRLAAPTPIVEVATVWYMGAAMGALIVTPPLLLLASHGKVQRRSTAEVASFLALAGVLAFVAFYPWRPAELEPVRLGFLVVVPIVWAAVRFGPLVTTWSALGLTAAGMAGLAIGTVPIYGSASQILLQMHSLSAVVTVLGLLLVANVHERDDNLAKLRVKHRELQRALEAVQRSQRAKTRFLNQAGHEMKTPLTPIRLRMHLLASDETLSPQQRQAVDAIQRNVARLTRLVDDLLGAARVQAEGDMLVPRDVAVRSLLAHAANVAASLATESGVTIEAQSDESRARVDVPAMGKALGHLLANAIRRSQPQGRVMVHGHKAGDRITISVIDHGQDIPEDQDEMFEPFAQAATPSPQSSGPGLGMYTARALVTAMGGTIHAEPTPGGGATVVVSVPGVNGASSMDA